MQFAELFLHFVCLESACSAKWWTELLIGLKLVGLDHYGCSAADG